MEVLKYTLFFLFSVTALCSQAQILQGKVYDAETKEAIVSATVYLNGTSYGTMTNGEGEFALNVDKVINTELIVSLMGYENAIVPDPFTEMPAEIYLARKPKQLDDIIIASPFSRKQMLETFRAYFLGNDEFGKACKIINEDEVKLSYDTDAKIFAARSDNPLVIENKLLGYTVNFTIMDFKVIYNAVSLNAVNCLKSYMLGTSSFQDMGAENKKAIKNRIKVYKESSNNFFRSFVNNTLKEDKFQIFNKGFSIQRDAYFSVTDTLNDMKKVEVLPDTNINKKLWEGFRPVGATDDEIEGKIDILYNKKLQSTLMLNTNSFMIDQYGNVDNINVKEIFFGGFLSDSRVGRMLPFDFEVFEK